MNITWKNPANGSLAILLAKHIKENNLWEGLVAACGKLCISRSLPVNRLVYDALSILAGWKIEGIPATRWKFSPPVERWKICDKRDFAKEKKKNEKERKKNYEQWWINSSGFIPSMSPETCSAFVKGREGKSTWTRGTDICYNARKPR